MNPPSPVERIQAALTAATSDPGRSLGRPRGLGWATVELDRAARELTAELGLPADAFAPAADSVVLGARCRVAPGALGGEVAVAILEPATEGLLAGMLARFGEGPAAIWFFTEDAASASGPGAFPGPFGPERPVPNDQAGRGGVRWFLIGPAAGTIPP
jgi:hypothetical protein